MKTHNEMLKLLIPGSIWRLKHGQTIVLMLLAVKELSTQKKNNVSFVTKKGKHMSKKVVINTCYGSFGLSEEAKKLGQLLSGNPNWSDDYPNSLKRDDPILVRVVEQLGSKVASAEHAELAIETVYGKYRICEHDGMEWIETPENIEWEE